MKNIYKKLFGYFEIIVNYICKLIFGEKYSDTHMHIVGSILLFLIFSLTRYIVFGIVATLAIGYIKEKYIDKTNSKKDMFYNTVGVFIGALITILIRELIKII